MTVVSAPSAPPGGFASPSPAESAPGLPASVYERSPTWARLMRTMQRTIAEFRLVEPGDRLLVAVSGGKDSYTLLDLLWQARRRAPFRFDLIAVHLDQGQPGYDGSPLEDFLRRYGAPFEILRQDTYSVVKKIVAEAGGQATYCAPCSRLRRGALYGAAERLGCNKLVLGHHREDTLETLLLNLLYAGKLQAMPAAYRTDDGRFLVIRPLVECGERDIAAHAAHAGYPILPCNLCGSQEGLKREKVGALLDSLETDIPDVRSVMLHALKNVRPTHLLDREVEAAYSARAAESAHAASPEVRAPEDLVTKSPGGLRKLRIL